MAMIRYYQEAIQISPSYIIAHINLGNTWERMSSLASANREIGVPGLEAEAALDNALKAYQAALAIDHSRRRRVRLPPSLKLWWASWRKP